MLLGAGSVVVLRAPCLCARLCLLAGRPHFPSVHLTEVGGQRENDRDISYQPAPLIAGNVLYICRLVVHAAPR